MVLNRDNVSEIWSGARAMHMYVYYYLTDSMIMCTSIFSPSSSEILECVSGRVACIRSFMPRELQYIYK